MSSSQKIFTPSEADPISQRSSCAINENELSLSTFGHIHHDARLIGTHLQGSTFTTTIHYLLKFLEYIQNPANDCGIAQADKESILIALHKTQIDFQRLMKFEIKKKNIIHMFADKRDNVVMNYANMQAEPTGHLEAEVNAETFKLATEITESLLTNGHVLIPGGWSGLPGETGHAMCYKFQMDQEGNCIFLVYNTGAGLNFHQTKEGNIEEYSPIKAYRIPTPISTKKENLNQFIQKLINPDVTPNIRGINTNNEEEEKHRFDENVIYKSIITKIHFLNGYEIDPTPYFGNYIEGQLSGTCSMRVLMPLLQNEMKDNQRAFKEYLYQLELQSIVDLYRIQKSNLTAPEIQRQLRFAIERFARSTLSLSTEDPALLSQERATASRRFINQIETSLNKALASPNNLVTTPLIQTETMGRYFDSIKDKGKAKRLMPKDIAKTEKIIEIFSLTTQLPDESIENFLKRCCEICLKNDVNLQSDNILRDIEQLFLSLPVNGEGATHLWSGLSPEQAKNCLEHLHQLTHLYGKHCYLKGGDPLPKRVITSLSGVLIASHLANSYFKNDKNFLYLADFLNADKLFSDKALKLREPYSVTMDPAYDSRVSEINNEFERILKMCQRPATEASNDFYDLQLIEKYNLRQQLIQQGLEMELQDIWDKLHLDQDMDKARHTLYILAGNYSNISEEGKKIVGDILDDLDFCTQFHEYYQSCLLFEKGSFDYFKKDKSNRTLRATGLWAQDGESGRNVYLNQNDTAKSAIKYSNGVVGNRGRVKSDLSKKLENTYEMQNPILREELFGESYKSPETNNWESRDKIANFNYDSNVALLQFKEIAENKFTGNDSLYHTVPFTRIRNSELRIIVTTDFYKQNLEKLNEHDYQTLFLLNLATPNLLYKQLDSTPELANNLVNLLGSNLNQYINDKKIEPAAYFAFRASGILYRYFQSYRGKEKNNPEIQLAKEKIKQFSSKLESLIETAKQNKNDGELKELSRLYIFLLSETTQSTTQFDNVQLKTFISSLFFKKNVPGAQGVTDDTVFKDDLENAFLKIYPSLVSEFNHLKTDEQEKLIREILTTHPYDALPIMQTIKTIKIDFPNVKIESTQGDNVYLNINFKTGKISAPDYDVNYIPVEFYDQQFIAYFGNAPIVAKTHLESLVPFCEFSRNNENYRVIRDDKGIVHIQKMMAKNKSWMELQNDNNFTLENGKAYELYLRTGSGKNEFGMFIESDGAGYKVVIHKNDGKHYEKKLPIDFNIDKENNIFNWKPIKKSTNKAAMLTPEVVSFIRDVVLEAGNDFNPVIYPKHIFEKDKQIWCDAASQLDYYVTDSSGSYFMAMETAMNRESREKHVRVKELSRNGSDTGYNLCLSQVYSDPNKISFYDLFSNFESKKFLEVWENTADIDKSYKISLPRYDIHFLATKLENGQWDIRFEENPNYRLKIDNSILLPEFFNALILENINNPKSDKICLMPDQEFDAEEEHVNEFYNVFQDKENNIPCQAIKKELGNSKDQSDRQWKFTDSSKLYLLNLDQNDQVITRTTTEFLYLAYIFLARNEPQKSLNYLKRCSELGGLEGRLEEIELIKKIMQDTPSSYSDSYKKTRVKNPETSSARLYAAYLMSELKEKRFDKPITDDLLPQTSSSPSNLNEEYSKIKYKNLSQFYNQGFQHEAAKNYDYYTKVLSHIPQNMRLEKNKERLFFQSIYKFQNRSELSTVQLNRYRDLKIDSLIKRKQTLLKRLHKNPADQTVLMQEIAVMDKKLKRNYKYSESIPSYEIRETDYTVQPRLNMDIVNRLERLENLRAPGTKPLKVTQLTMSVTEQDFLVSFKNFYSLAQSLTSDRVEKAMLKEFVKNMLLSQSSVLKPQDENSHDYIIQLCTLLAYVLDKPNNAIGRPWHSLEDSHSFSGQYLYWHFESIVTECKNAYHSSPLKYLEKKYSSHSKTKVEIDKEVKLEEKEIKAHLLPTYPYHNLCKELNISLTINNPNEINAEEKSTTQILQKYEDMETFTKSEIENFNKDYVQGRKLNQIENRNKQVYADILKSSNTRNALLELLGGKFETKTNDEALEDKLGVKKSGGIITQKAEILKQVHQSLLEMANKHILGVSSSLNIQLEVAGKSKLSISWNDLQLLYLQNDLNAVINKTQLSESDAKWLLNEIHHYLLEETAQQQRIRVTEQLKKLQIIPEESPDYMPSLIKLGTELNSNRCYDPTKHPEMLLFEYADNKLLRPQQVNVIEKILAENQLEEGIKGQVIQLIMGGGKTKVLLPILALKKANGTNLSILELPSGAFTTNFADLESTTVSAFGQIGHPFIFSRDAACHSVNLKSLYKKLKNIIEQKHYLMTTAESIQAFELKYFEFLKNPPDLNDKSEVSINNQKEWKNQVKYTEKIIDVFKTKGDAIIDEVDSTLDPKKELNYSIGGQLSIKTAHLKTIQQLYNLFKFVDIKLPTEVEDTFEVKTLLEILLNEIIIPDPLSWKKAFSDLAKQLTYNQESPLFAPIQSAQLTENQKLVLQAFILQQKPTPKPDFLDRLFSIEAREKIYLMKGELSVHLANTFNLTANVNYGFPLNNASGMPKSIAVPFIANNTPSKRAQFGSYYKTLNCTLNLYEQPKEKISLPTIKEFINDFKTRARVQVEQSNGRIAFRHTVDAIEFAKLTKMDLETLDPTKDDLNILQESWSLNKNLKDFCILNYDLNKIKNHPFILPHNGVNHVMQYNRVDAVTGTPYNARCFFGLRFNAEDGFGIDGQTVDNFIRKSTEKSIHIPTEKLPILSFGELYDKHPRKADIHALIDVGAHFKGISNLEVAKNIFQKLQHRQSSIKCILYYNDDSVLCAWNGKAEKEVRSTDIDDIDAITGTTREQRFTYYDQLHTTGTDITQAMNAIGLVTFGKDTLARDFGQAKMRMRDLSGSQSVEVMLSQDIVEANPGIKNWQPYEIVNLGVKNQINKLNELHYQAAVQKMHAIIREDFFSRIKLIKDPFRKAEHFKIFEELFLIKNEMDPIQQFSGMEQTEIDGKKVTTGYALQRISRFYFEKWQTLLKEHHAALGDGVQRSFVETDKANKIRLSFDEIITKTSQTCLENRTIMIDEAGDVKLQSQEMVVETQQEKDQEKNKEKEKDLEKQQSIQKSYVSAAKPSNWTDTIDEFYHKIESFDFSHTAPNCMPINSIFNADHSFNRLPKKHKSPEFSYNLYVSHNYRQTINNQKNPMDDHRKPVNVYMVMRDPTNFLGSLRTAILTQEDAEYWKKQIESGSNAIDACIVSTANTRVCGNKAILESPHYQNIREQICYFNGDIDILSKGFASSTWMKDNLQEKLSYLENVILFSFPEKRKWLQVLIATSKKMEENKELKDLVWALKEKDLVLIRTALDAVISKYDSSGRASILGTLINEEKTVLETALELNSPAINEILKPFTPKEIHLITPASQKNNDATLFYTNEAKSDMEALLERDPDQAFEYFLNTKTTPLPSQTEEWKQLLKFAIKNDATARVGYQLVQEMFAELKKEEFKAYANAIYDDSSLFTLALSSEKPKNLLSISSLLINDGNFHLRDFSDIDKWNKILRNCIMSNDYKTCGLILKELNASEFKNAILDDGSLIKLAFVNSSNIFDQLVNHPAVKNSDKTLPFLLEDNVISSESFKNAETMFVNCSRCYRIESDQQSYTLLEDIMNEHYQNLLLISERDFNEMHNADPGIDSRIFLWMSVRQNIASMLSKINTDQALGFFMYRKWLMMCTDLACGLGENVNSYFFSFLIKLLTADNIEKHILPADNATQNEFIQELASIGLNIMSKEKFIQLIDGGIISDDKFNNFRMTLLDKLEQLKLDITAESRNKTISNEQSPTAKIPSVKNMSFFSKRMNSTEKIPSSIVKKSNFDEPKEKDLKKPTANQDDKSGIKISRGH